MFKTASPQTTRKKQLTVWCRLEVENFFAKDLIVSTFCFVVNTV